MSVSQPDKNRRLLPRWQPSTMTISVGELQPVEIRARGTVEDPHFEARKAEWEEDRSIDVAAELVASAIVLGRTSEIEPAARLLAEDTSDVSATLREMARQALGHRPGLTLSARRPAPPGRLVTQSLYGQISRLRYHLHRNPRDAYAWIDMARLYTILGQNLKARKAVLSGLAVAPQDRFALRTAARFFVHVDEPDTARQILLRARATKHDPWLMAAEIAVSQVAKRPSLTANHAHRSLKQGTWAPRSNSEMAGSLATLMLEDGAAHKSRNLFRQSLRDPTENAVAQAQWAAGNTTGLIVPAQFFSDPNGHEARALRDGLLGNWDDAIDRCWDWADYEPTSSRPMMMGSYFASIAYEDGQTIVNFADRGLTADPRDATLLNNKAVGLAYLGQLDDAAEILHTIIIDHTPIVAQPALYATTGLLFFRAGDLEKGRYFYEKAINHRYSRQDRRCHTLALWHLAREEVRLKSTEAIAAVARAEHASKGMKLAEINTLRDRLADGVKKMSRSGSVSSISRS